MPGSLPDEEQREHIRTELGVSMLVEAAAGTGKTTMLLGRMVELIRTGTCEKVSGLAAITFTRKAAAELRSRFQAELEKKASQATGEERVRLDHALAHIEQSFIGTIHSFCARLLRERPLEAGIDIAFEEVDETADKLLRIQAWEEFAALALTEGPGGVIDRLNAAGLHLNDLKAAFDKYADCHDIDEWPVYSCSETMPSAEELNALLLGCVVHMEDIQPSLPDEDGKLIRFKQKYHVIPLKFRQSDPADMVACMAIIKELNDDRPGYCRPTWKTLDQLEKDLIIEEQAWWEDHKVRVDTAGLLEMWSNYRYEIALGVLEEARRYYDGMRERLGVLNFQDLLMKAAALLRTSPQVRRYFADRYSFLLVDEFQDTDPVQAEMMFLLTASDLDSPGLDWLDCEPREGALFVVGDPKQSIYRFRRADIATYNLVKLRFDEWENGEVLELFANFRSVEEILDFVDETFCDEFERPGSPTPESPAYVKLEKCREDANRGGLTGIRVLEVPGKDDGKADPEAEADYIARFIVDSVQKGKTVTRRKPDDGDQPEPEKVSYGDFMVITYLKDELDPITRRLQELGAPCRVTGGGGLDAVPELKVLIVCLKAVINPDNPVLLVAALRSELFGLSDKALYSFKKAKGVFDYRRVDRIPVDLPESERAAFVDAFTRLGESHLLLSRHTAIAALERIADDLGLFALAGAREGGNIASGSLAKAFEILRSSRGGRWTVSQMLKTLEELATGSVKTDGISALPELTDAVQIINLHKVKGLQAPIVFLAGLSSPHEFDVELHIDRSTGDTLGFMEIIKPNYRGKWSGTPIAHPHDWKARQDVEDVFVKKEKLRLNYVAATRAESMMVISLSGGKAESRWSAFEAVLNETDRLEVPAELEALATGTADTSSFSSPSDASDAIRTRLGNVSCQTYDLSAATDYALRATGKTISPRMTPIERETESLADVLEDAERGILWGTVIHALLELEMGKVEGDLSSIAASLLSENGLDMRFADDAVALVESVKRSTIWKRATASRQCFPEVPFGVMREDDSPPTLLRGKIDLAFCEEAGWVIIDYKTDRPGALASEKLIKKYISQVELYADAWKQCTGEEVVEAGIFFVTTGEYRQV